VVYHNRKSAAYQQKVAKEQYLDSISRVHLAWANEHQQKKQEHESKLKRLELIEEQMIGTLQRTLQRKNEAIDVLQKTSPCLKKTVQPRMAYSYKNRNGGSSL